MHGLLGCRPSWRHPLGSPEFVFALKLLYLRNLRNLRMMQEGRWRKKLV
jgi:hypothetical protein